MKKLNQTVAVVEVGQDYTDRLRTIEVENCSMAQAQQVARDMGYQVIVEHCAIVHTTDETHLIVTVAPDGEEEEAEE